MTTDNEENFRKAYEEVCKSHRAIDDFRARLLALLPLASGIGGLTLLSSQDTVRTHMTASGLFGVAITAGLLIYELNGARRCRRLKRSLRPWSKS